jgi:hypothetical protein
MVVALRALDLQAEEDARGGARERLEAAGAACARGDEADGARVAHVARGREELVGDPIVGPVLRERLDEPARRIELPLELRRLALGAEQQIAVDVAPVLGELVAAEQTIDDARAAVGLVVGEVALRLGERRDAAESDRASRGGGTRPPCAGGAA